MSETCGRGPELSSESCPKCPNGVLQLSLSRASLGRVSRTICSEIQKLLFAHHSRPLVRMLLPTGFALLASPSAKDLPALVAGSFLGYSHSCVRATIPSLS